MAQGAPPWTTASSEDPLDTGALRQPGSSRPGGLLRARQRRQTWGQSRGPEPRALTQQGHHSTQMASFTSVISRPRARGRGRALYGMFAPAPVPCPRAEHQMGWGLHRNKLSLPAPVLDQHLSKSPSPSARPLPARHRLLSAPGAPTAAPGSASPARAGPQPEPSWPQPLPPTCLHLGPPTCWGSSLTPRQPHARPGHSQLPPLPATLLSQSPSPWPHGDHENVLQVSESPVASGLRS